MAGEKGESLAELQQAMAETAPTVELLERAVHAATREARADIALRCAAAAERLAPHRPDLCGLTFDALVRLGAPAEALAALERKARAERFTTFGTVLNLCILAGLAGRGDAVRHLLAQVGKPDGLPAGKTGLFIAMPKSAGATIARSVSARLGAAFVGIGADLQEQPGLPAPWLPEEMVRLFAGRQALLFCHAAALARNGPSFGRFDRPLTVHLRDPRDALVSLFEMAEGPSSLQALRFLYLRPDYALLSRTQRLATLRDRVYPMYLAWIDGWVRQAEAEPGSVSFSTFEEFVTDQEGVIERLARRYGASPAETADVYVMHYRQGIVGGHRQVFTDTQSHDMFDAIPPAARGRFGWQR